MESSQTVQINTKNPAKRLLIAFLLWVVSIILKWVVTIIGLIFMPAYYLLALIFGWSRPVLWEWFYNMALSNDQHAACVNATTLQVFTTKRGAFYFGDPDDTASYVYGRNYYRQKNNALGRGIVWILNKVDKDHVIKAVNNKKEADKNAALRFKLNNYD